MSVDENSQDVVIVKKEKSSGLFLTSMNATNTIIGSGITTLPMSLQWGGATLSLMLVSLVGILTDFTMVIMGRALESTQAITYPDMMLDTLGKFGCYPLILCQAFAPMLSIFGIGILIVESLKNIFTFLAPQYSILQNNYVLLSIPIYLVIFPVSSFRNISFLDKFSLLSVLLVVYCICVIISQAVFYPPKIIIFEGFMDIVKPGFVQTVSFLSFSIIGLCFSCQEAVPSIYMCLKNKCAKRFSISSHLTCLFTLTFYSFIGLTGFVSFAGQVNNSNVMQSYCPENIVITTARLAFILSLILTCPCQIFACREAILSPIFARFDFRWSIHIGVTFLICSLMFLIAAHVTDLGTVVAISGSLFGGPLSIRLIYKGLSQQSFVFPALGYMASLRSGWLPNSPAKFGCYIVILFGITSCVLGTYMALKYAGTHREAMYWCDSCVEKSTTPKDLSASITREFLKIWSS